MGKHESGLADRRSAWVRAILFAGLACVLAAGIAAVGPTRTAAAEPAFELPGENLVAGTGQIGVQATDYDVSWYEGHESPYTITNYRQLKGLAHLVNTGADTFEGKTVQLKTPSGKIVYTSGLMTPIEPIGTPGRPFEGTFDGGGTQIQNVPLDIGTRLSNIGLFGYAGDKATIKFLHLLGGANGVNVANAAAGKTISNIGAIAGHLGGSMDNCTSTVKVSVTNNGAVPASTGKSAEDLCTILNVGGLVGSIGGDLTHCDHGNTELSISSTSNVTEGVPFIGGRIGGVAGYQGDEGDAAHVTETSYCRNSGRVVFSVSGSGGVDRFGAQMYSKSSMVGGIVGYTMGDVSNCANEAELQTGYVVGGAAQAGFGASTVGGIVGSLRGPTIAEAESATGVVGANDTDPGYSVWTESNGATAPATLAITNCKNTAPITGLASVAGIAGSTGAFTKVVGCFNTGLIQGTRWNKPCPAGIVGISNGDIAYCYNQGRCFSTTGGGYYASGITALLTTYNTSATPDDIRLDAPELYGCYVTGNIGGASTGYRTAVLAGENDGFIHDNCFLPNLTVDKVVDKDVFGDEGSHSRLVSSGEDRGTLKNNHELSADAMKTSQAVGYLNKPYAQAGDWSLHYAPKAGSFPVLSWEGATVASPVELSSVATGIASVENPAFSAVNAPVPIVQLSTNNGTALYQDADYKVVVSDDARAVGGSYTATIVGINGYTGELAAKASYSVAKAGIDTCIVRATPSTFNWEKQEPKSVTVYDKAGNLVDPAEYTCRTLANDDGSTKAVNGKYYDYINCHGQGYKYDIEVTAKDTSPNYTGSTTQAAFRIGWASIMYSPDNDGRTDIPESAKLGNVVWDGQEWDIAKALKTKGYVKVKYTGSEIKPTFKSVTYLGREMRNGTGKPYYYNPLDYDYMYVYGNPNPEPGSEQDNQCTNVTGSKETQLGCVTVRFTSGGNFDNYTNVFYEITPASIASDVKIEGMAASYAYTGSAVRPAPKLTYNGMTLVAGKDYTLSYANNTQAGKATVTIAGKGNYTGKVTKTFSITAASIAKASVSVGSKTFTGKALSVKPVVKLGSATLKQGTDYTVSAKTSAGKAIALTGIKNAGSYKITVTGKGNYTGSAAVAFKVNKAKNTLKVSKKSRSIAYKKLKKKKQTVKAITVKGAKGTVTYAKKSGNKKITVAKKTGKITAKKGLKKGKYTVKVQVSAKGNANYLSAKKTVSFKIVVK